MSDAAVGQLIVAGTALFSGFLGLMGGILIEQLRIKRDREAAAVATQNQRDDFQRQTLLELQEAITRFGRAIGRSHHHDEMEFKQSGTWGRSLIGDELDEELLASQVQVMNLRERVRDDELRRLVNRFYNIGIQLTMARARQDAAKGMDDWLEALNALNDRLGAVLRSYV